MHLTTTEQTASATQTIVLYFNRSASLRQKARQHLEAYPSILALKLKILATTRPPTVIALATNPFHYSDASVQT
eukprot:762890-Pleurochrysis_carterae.AAC.4